MLKTQNTGEILDCVIFAAPSVDDILILTLSQVPLLQWLALEKI